MPQHPDPGLEPGTGGIADLALARLGAQVVVLNGPASFDSGTLALLDKSGQTVKEISVGGKTSPHTMQIENATGSIAFVGFEFEWSPGHIFRLR